MTNKLADAYDNAAEALAALALRVREYEEAWRRGDVGPPTSPDASGAPSFEELPFDQDEYEDRRGLDPEPHGSLAVCPKHGTSYSPGRYGPYCQSPSDDPLWRNAKGFCNLTPKNAAIYLRQKAAAR